jgi:hypothetical protein
MIALVLVGPTMEDQAMRMILAAAVLAALALQASAKDDSAVPRQLGETLQELAAQGSRHLAPDRHNLG